MWICENQTLRSSGLFAKFCARGTKGIAVMALKILRTEVGSSLCLCDLACFFTTNAKQDETKCLFYL